MDFSEASGGTPAGCLRLGGCKVARIVELEFEKDVGRNSRCVSWACLLMIRTESAESARPVVIELLPPGRGRSDGLALNLSVLSDHYDLHHAAGRARVAAPGDGGAPRLKLKCPSRRPGFADNREFWRRIPGR